MPSLTYLKKFPLDRLKIDKSFVRELRANSDDAAIVGTTIKTSPGCWACLSLPKALRTAPRLICEENGVRGRTGVLFGRPMPAAEFEQSSSRRDAQPICGISATERADTAA